MYPSQAIALFVVSSIFPFCAVVAVGLRLYARRLTDQAFAGSDYWILFTLLCALLNAIACIIGAAACGVGLPLASLVSWQEVRFLKILFVTQFFYIFSVWSVKISVLLFYKRVFKTSAGLTRAANYTLLFLGAWIVAFFFVTLFQDNPVQRNWGTVGTTINWRIFYIAEVASDLALDIFILCLPAMQIARLQMSTKRKWLLAGVFALGGLIVIASTVRLAYMVVVMEQFQVEDDDFSFSTVNTIIWGSIEPCTSVVAACLPVMSPILFRKQRAVRDARRKAQPNLVASFFRSSRVAKPKVNTRYDSLLGTDAGEELSSSATQHEFEQDIELPAHVLAKQEILRTAGDTHV